MMVRYTTRLDGAWLVAFICCEDTTSEVGTESEGDGFPGSGLGDREDLLGSESYRSVGPYTDGRMC